MPSSLSVVYPNMCRYALIEGLSFDPTRYPNEPSRSLSRYTIMAIGGSLLVLSGAQRHVSTDGGSNAGE